jgi:hypothetical protein
MLSVFLALLLVSLCVWMEALCGSILQAVGTGRPQDWGVVAMIGASPLPPIVASNLI